MKTEGEGGKILGNTYRQQPQLHGPLIEAGAGGGRKQRGGAAGSRGPRGLVLVYGPARSPLLLFFWGGQIEVSKRQR